MRDIDGTWLSEYFFASYFSTIAQQRTLFNRQHLLLFIFYVPQRDLLAEHLLFLQKDVEPFLVVEFRGFCYYYFSWLFHLPKEFIRVLLDGNSRPTFCPMIPVLDH